MIRKLIFILLIALSFATNVNAQWAQTNGPYGGAVTCFATIGTSLFAGTADGVYLSTDSGKTWTWSGSGLPNTSYGGVTALAVIGTNLFAGIDGVVFLSSDKGVSWTSASTGLTYSSIFALAAIGTNLFAVEQDDGIFRSTNNGATWFAANSGLPSNPTVTSFAAIGSDLFADIDYGGGVYFSANNGTSWIRASTGLPGGYANAFAEIGTHLFAGTYDSGVYLSTNNGFTWTASSLSNTGVGAFAVFDSVLYAGTSTRVFSSSDNGESWTLCSNFPGLPLVWGVNLFVYESGDVFLSTDKGTSWSEAPSKGLASTNVSDLEVIGTNIFASYDYGISSTADYGTSWTTPSLGLTRGGALAAIGTNIFVGTDQGVFLSTDYGASFFSVSNGLTNEDVTAFVASGDDLFAGTEGSFGADIFLSTNNGSSWNAIDSVFAGGSSTTVNSLAVIGANIFAGISIVYGYSGIFLSSNNGMNWAEPADSGLSRSPYILAVFGGNLLAVNSYSGDSVFLSSNNGTSWTLANEGLPKTGSINCFAFIGTNAFAGTDSGVFLSTNNGTSWTAVNSGIRDSNILSLAVSGTYLYAGTAYSGVWQRPLSEMIGNSSVKDQAPAGTSISAYPNPLSQSTTIRFTSPESGVARVTVVNLLGEEVARVFEGALTSGEHSFLWSKPPGLPNGMYECVVQMNGSVQQVPMVITQ